MASNAREDTQSNNFSTDIEVEVQSNANPTSETPQPTDNNTSNPEGSNLVEGDNKANVKSAYWEYFDRFKVEGEWKAKCKFCKSVLSANPKNEWNVDRKLSTVTLDNCSTNDAMIDELLGRLDSSFLMLGGKLLHMRCCAHILNLIVKDGLSIVKESIEKIRSSVLYWTATPKRNETFASWCAKTAIPFTKKLVLDCPTRWNSTYLMLDTALLYRAVFPRLRQKEPQYKTVPSNEEWELAKEICDRLKLFYDVTQLMKKKFEKYWDEIHGIMGVAAVLDPRYKMVGVEFQFGKMYPDPIECSKQVDRIHQLCNELVNEYNQKMSSDVSHVGTK
ncbi:zinc finger BED domain-containing protein RICESLEEPER 2-like [Arachis stenosperma]|uniref:zinc finger BED domain-containing protein RICESLEEPER 2-like n=1 Tax=Arachis stenosperma TaxID=217475 RepID=UPI0025ABCB7F|nr:zinc finger BED domain-containing protein RICESLEEPER 2-like [Arachis stenosperma]